MTTSLITDPHRPRWIRRIDARIRLTQIRGTWRGYLALACMGGILAMATVVVAHAVGLLILSQIPGAL